MTTRERLNIIAQKRIIILDGAMGSMLQSLHLNEADFRGAHFAHHPTPLVGCNDLLCLTMPDVVASISKQYLAAGADIIKTCSFNATAVSLADYGLADRSYQISYAAGRIARQAADQFSSPDHPRFVAGSMGPTAKGCGIAPDMDDPSKRAIFFDELSAAYYDNARGLLDGGADLLLIETIFDTLNAKAAIAAVLRLQQERCSDVPVMLSATIAGESGRLLAGQTVDAFCVSVMHARPWSIGLNCSFGAEKLFPSIKAFAAVPCWISVHPNAGLPGLTGYDETPALMARHLEPFLQEGAVNIVGGCCGTGPAHIAAIAELAQGYAPRKIEGKERSAVTCFAGLETLTVNKDVPVLIGERTNVAGSKKFLRLIREERYSDALNIAAAEIKDGAAMIDVCLDDALLEGAAVMSHFLLLAQSDPDSARVPVMIDSSRPDVIESALKCVSGKCLINSISLKEGEAALLRRSRIARFYGAGVVVMLFDEAGQADTFERKIAVAQRAYTVLTGDGFPPEDIVFDPNVLAIGTGIAEQDSSASDFIRACAWIRSHCPSSNIVGGISNLSFSFRSRHLIREALHAVFLKYATGAGLTMAIVNPATCIPYEAVDPVLCAACEDLIFNRRPDAADRLIALATAESPAQASAPDVASWRAGNAEERVVYALVHGVDEFILADVQDVVPWYANPLDIVENVLMKGMAEVGARFEAGDMFLPQVIRSARVMKKAVALLPVQPGDTGPATAAKIVLATVRGDVHDIGKNIVSTVLGCSGYRIIDLGVMVPAQRIIEVAFREGAALIGLSGLILPSLDEMVIVAQEMERHGMHIPLLIGGAAASYAHTAIKIAPCYSGPVIYCPDASQASQAVHAVLSDRERDGFLKKVAERYTAAKTRRQTQRKEPVVVRAASAPAPEPRIHGIVELNGYPVEQVLPFFDWNSFLREWDIPAGAPDAVKSAVRADAQLVLDRVVTEHVLELRGVIGFFPATSDHETIIVYDEDRTREIARFTFPRHHGRCLSDHIAPASDWMGFFALSAGFGDRDAEDLLLAALINALTEAFSEAVHRRIQQEWWGTACTRPAFGYPACPDHGDKRTVFGLLQAPERCGFTLTKSAMIVPAASVCGMYLNKN